MRGPIRNAKDATHALFIGVWRHANLTCEERAERAQTAEADFETNVRDRPTFCQQSLSSSQSFARSELIRRLAERRFETTDEMKRRQTCLASGIINGGACRMNVSESIATAAKLDKRRVHCASPDHVPWGTAALHRGRCFNQDCRDSGHDSII